MDMESYGIFMYLFFQFVMIASGTAFWCALFGLNAHFNLFTTCICN